jgi:outer membrane protein
MMMKRLPIILNLVLLVAVAVLYILHFASHKGNSAAVGSAPGTVADVKGSLKVAFVNIDSLISKYDLYKDNVVKLGGKQKQMEAELNEKTEKYQKDNTDAQYKYNKGLLTSTEAQELGKKLNDEQQNLVKLRDQLSQELAEQQQVMNRKMVNEIEKYLKDYTKLHPYHYIFSYSFGQNLLYANDSLDITREVLLKLNENYQELNKGKK